jgi:hypothetical protein
MPYITVGKDLTDVSFWKGRSRWGSAFGMPLPAWQSGLARRRKNDAGD